MNAQCGIRGNREQFPPTWLGFDSRSRCHMWSEFVVGYRPCSERFSPHFQIRSGISGGKATLWRCHCKIPVYYYYSFNFIYLFILYYISNAFCFRLTRTLVDVSLPFSLLCQTKHLNAEKHRTL